MKYSIIITEEYEDKRVDVALSDFFDISRSSLQNRIPDKNILVNGHTKSLSYKLKIKDKISFELAPLKLPSLKPQNIPINIIYEDNEILIINKSSGLVVHAGGGVKDGTLVNALMYHFKDQFKHFGDTLRPGIVHRLDKDTSGVMIIAKNLKSMEIIQKQFANREITKEYHAIVQGIPKQDTFTIDGPIGRSSRNRKKMSINGIKAKNAMTEINVIEKFKDYTYLKAFPKTGRTHQVRVHLSSKGFPLIGDSFYGAKPTPKSLDFIKRFLLHAHKITFTHPKKNTKVEFIASLPDDFILFLDKFSKKN